MQRPIKIGVWVGIVAAAFLAMAEYVSTHSAALPVKNAFVGSASLPRVGSIPNTKKTNQDYMHTLPILANAMPQFSGIASWHNSPPLTPELLRGKVVLIDFWTYSCINCLRTLPYLTSWDAKYRDKGLVIVGVHTPEFAFEKGESNVRDAIAEQHIAYPVALDNAYATWNAYNNRYWPASYLFDANGRLRYTHFGEGNYDITEGNIQALLKEVGAAADIAKTTVTSTVDFSAIGSRETYLGYARLERFASPEHVRKDAENTYTVPDAIQENQVAFEGRWHIDRERAEARGAAAIAYRFTASNVNLVMGLVGTIAPVLAEVTMDGTPVPASYRGPDIVEQDGKTYVTVSKERLYSLIEAPGIYETHLFRIQFTAPGVAVYALTFG